MLKVARGLLIKAGKQLNHGDGGIKSQRRSSIATDD
jgi:hypothetical protein